MTRTVALIVVCATVMLGGCNRGGDIEGTVKELLAEQQPGRWEQAYDSLHPAQQEAIGREAFLACADEVVGAVDTDSVEIIETHDESIVVEGVTVDAKAVEMRAETSGEEQTITRYYTKEDGKWRWFVEEPEAFADC